MTTQTIYSKRKSSAITKNNAGLFLLFLIWPLVAFLVALSKYEKKDSKRVVYLFLVYYGFTFTAANLAMDSRGFAETLLFTAKLPFNQFWNIVAGIYAVETSVDIIQPFIIFVVSRLTEDSRFLFAAFSAFFGYFYLKSIEPLFLQYKTRPNPNALIHLVFFVLLVPIFEINGFRFWTAAWVFFYGAYHMVLTGNKKYLIFSFIAAFIHFSFLSVNAILLIYVFLGNRNTIYLPLLALSFVIPELFSTQISEFVLYLPGGLEAKYTAYSNQDYSEQIREYEQSAKWFMKWPRLLVVYYFVVAMLTLKFRYKKWVSDSIMNNLFSFTILILSFSNFVKYIPSMGRFQTIFLLFATAYLVIFYVRFGKLRLNFLTKTGLLPMLIVIVVVIRVGLETMNIWVFAPLPFGILAPGLPLAPLIF